MVKIYLIDEVNAKIEGVEESLMEEMVEEMKLPIKGSYSLPSVQLGLHDGKEEMLTERGLFCIKQLDTIFEMLLVSGCREDEIDIEDLREPLKHPVGKFVDIDESFFKDYVDNDLWEHQVDYFNIIQEVNGQGIFDASTSAGKTLIMAGTAKLYDEYYPSLCVTLNKKLVNDAAKMMDKFGLDYGILDSSVKTEDRPDFIKNHRHIITTRKIAINQRDDFEDFFGSFIVDEVHILGDAFYEFGTTAMANAPIRIGLSGSLPEKSQDPLKRQRIFNMIGGGVIQEVLPSYLMDKGYAATVEIREIKIDDSTGKEKQSEAGKLWDWQMEEAFYNSDKTRAEAIADYIDKHCPRNTLIICRPEMGKMLSSILECDFIDGNVAQEAREECYRKFDEMDDYRLVSTSGTSGVGLSIDMVHYGALIDIGENPSIAGQAAGRFMRKDHVGGNKDHSTVYSFFSNLKYGARHKRGRVKYFKKRGFIVNDNYDTIKI